MQISQTELTWADTYYTNSKEKFELFKLTPEPPTDQSRFGRSSYYHVTGEALQPK